MGSRMLDQARLDWVTKHLKLTHYIYSAAADGDVTATSLRALIYQRAHLTENQIRFAMQHIRDLRPNADLDESNSTISETRETASSASSMGATG